MADVKWKLDESNEVAFKVNINSSEPVSGAPVVRLVCEASGIDYAFPGKFSGSDEVEVIIPPMEGKLNEGEYKTRLEVILEDRYFVPLKFDAEFGITTKVVAEILQKEEKTILEDPRPVKASFISKPKANTDASTLRFKNKDTGINVLGNSTRLKSLKEKFGQ